MDLLVELIWIKYDKCFFSMTIKKGKHFKWCLPFLLSCSYNFVSSLFITIQDSEWWLY